MEFNLRRPCKNCPFRTDCTPEWLGRARASEIVNSITVEDQRFSCHVTNEFGENDDGETVPIREPEHCAGAAILLEKIEQPNQWMRIAERLGGYDHSKLDMGSPVFDDPDDFIEHHSSDREREDEPDPCSVAEPGCLAPAGYATSGGAISNHDIDPEVMTTCEECGEPVCEACAASCCG